MARTVLKAVYFCGCNGPDACSACLPALLKACPPGTGWATGFLLAELAWPSVSTAAACSGHCFSPRADGTGRGVPGPREGGLLAAAALCPPPRPCCIEPHCAEWLQVRGEQQKGTLRDGKSHGGGKELAVLPLTLLALNKCLLVL